MLKSNFPRRQKNACLGMRLKDTSYPYFSISNKPKPPTEADSKNKPGLLTRNHLLLIPSHESHSGFYKYHPAHSSGGCSGFYHFPF